MFKCVSQPILPLHHTRDLFSTPSTPHPQICVTHLYLDFSFNPKVTTISAIMSPLISLQWGNLHNRILTSHLKTHSRHFEGEAKTPSNGSPPQCALSPT